MSNKFYFLGVLIVFASLVSACRPGGGGKKTPVTSKDKAKTVEKETVDANTPITTTKIGQINYYLENSHSMAGYFQTKTRFYDVTDKILTDLILRNRFIDRVNTFTIAEEIDAFETIEAFRSQLNPTNSTRIASATSSPLHTILGTVCENSNENDINIFVTDGIVSGTNDQLARYDNPKKEKYFNIDMISSIQNEVKINLDRYAGTFGIKLLAYTSNYDSTKKHPYYKLDNNKSGRELGEFTNRPFYIFIIAKPELLVAFEEKCKGVFEPDEFMEVGFKYPETNLMPNRFYLKSKNIEIGSKEIRFSRNEEDFRFSIVANLAKFDEKYGNESYLKENVKLYLNGRLMDNVEVNGLAINNIEDGWIHKNNRAIQALRGYTHLLDISISDYRPDKSDELILKLVNQKNDWVADWSSQSDLDIQLGDNTTFGFNYLVEGILEAYEEDTESYLITYPISLTVN